MEQIHSIEKRRIALRYWLLGAGMTKAGEAMEFAETYHTGKRKDEVTPEVAHQISIVSYLRTLLGHLSEPEDTLVTGFLHDVREDYDVSDAQIRSQFGDRPADAVWAMTKVWLGEKRDEDALFAAMAEDPIASITKPADRINNLDSMVGVFTKEKMSQYADETRTLFLPMIKKARRNFPGQEGAYENAKLVLLGQLRFVDAIVESKQS